MLIDALRPMQPRKLFIVADGPRQGREQERDVCNKVRDILVNQIDWECQVVTQFREENLGCGRGVSGAITWFFEQVEAGIILEDDCIPNASFFPFCTEMLNKYWENATVMHISGNNFQLGNVRGDGSYYFSKYPNIWGWATWRRAWKHYQFELEGYVTFFQDYPHLEQAVPKKMLDAVYSGALDTWDTQWLYCVIKSSGLAITPNVNLVQNIGFGNGVHTNESPYYYRHINHGEIAQIVHPSTLERDEVADDFSNKLLYNLSLQNKVRDKLHKLKQHYFT